MPYQYITVRFENHIAHLSLNRPSKHNALCIAMVQELNQFVKQCATDSKLKAVFISGNEKAFSAGGDLKEMQFLNQDEAEIRSKYVQDTFRLYAELPVPVIAFISGICFGGGLEFALHCDFRIASSTAKLALPEVKYGMIPGAGGTVQLPLQMAKADAAYFLLTGSEIPLQKALSNGLVQKIVEPMELDEEKEKMQAYISSASAEALSAVKKMLILSDANEPNKAYQTESALFAKLLCENGRGGIEQNFKK